MPRDRIFTARTLAETGGVSLGKLGWQQSTNGRENAQTKTLEIRHRQTADALRYIADRIRTGCITISSSVGKSSDPTGIEHYDEATRHIGKRFGVKRNMPPLVATVVIAIVCAFFSSAALAQITPGAPGAPAPLPAPPLVASPTPAADSTPTPLTTVAPSAGPSGASPAPTPPTGRRLRAFKVSADRVAFYSSKYIVGADGDVDVTLGDGTRITGNTFSMDLRLDRFVIAGNVTLTAGGLVQHGAAFSEFFDFDRAYFVPITSEPDRWTFAAGDYAHPLLGREMPGDTFFLPDLSGDRVFLDAKHATIDPMQSVRFSPASVNFGLNTYISFPSYFLNFSPNPNFAQNSLPGAYIDGPLDFAGGEHDLATLHLRYDSENKLFPAIEGHIVSDRSYVVGSVSPITRPLKEYNLLAFDRISPGLQIQTDFQETAFQHSFTQPLSATGYAAIQITGSLRQSYLQLSTQNYYDSLLGMPKPVFVDVNGVSTPQYYYGDPSHNFVPDHPVNVQLSWIGYRQKLGRYLRTQVRSSVSFAHNSFTPLMTLGGVNYNSIYGKSLGVDVATEPLVLLNDAVKRPKVYLSAIFDKQRAFYSLPHFVDTQTETISLTDVLVPRKLTALASYTNQNTGDFYGAQQSLAYPPSEQSTYINPYTGQVVPQFASFRGFATTRSFAEQFIFTPSTDLTFNLGLRENRDFPVAVAGPPTIVGPNTAFQNYGVPPYQADLDLRYRFTPALVLEVERSYFFGFGGYERWSPQFYVQILK